MIFKITTKRIETRDDVIIKRKNRVKQINQYTWINKRRDKVNIWDTEEAQNSQNLRQLY